MRGEFRCKMRKKFLLLVLLFIPLLSWTQETKPIVRFTPFEAHGISAEEIRFIESLIMSYVSETGEVRFQPDNTPADFIISGSISLEHKGRIFTLEIRNTQTNEITKSTTVHRTTGELVLKARSLVDNNFKIPVQTAKESSSGTEPETPETISERNITGTWRGEAEIEIIRLRPGGRGIALSFSGSQIDLVYTITNNILTINAESMRWEMQLFSGGTRLKGTKIAAGIRGNSLWVRSNR